MQITTKKFEKSFLK